MLTKNQSDIPEAEKKLWGIFFLYFATVFFLFWIPFSIFFFLIHRTEVKADFTILQERERNQISGITTVISKSYLSIFSDLMMIGRLHEMEKVFNGATAENRDLESDLLTISRIKKSYDQIRYLDESGTEILRINFNRGKPEVVSTDRLQNKAGRYYFDETFSLNKDEIFISPMDLNIEHGEIEIPLKPMVRVGTPVYSREGTKRGILLINFFGEQVLRYFDDFQTGNEGGLSFLNPEGYWLKAPDSSDEWGFMFPEKKNRTFARRYPEAWEKVSSGETGQFRTRNGLFTFATLNPVADYIPSFGYTGESREEPYYYKVVSHIPEETLTAMSLETAIPMLIVYGVISIFLVTASLGFAHFRETQKRMELNRERLIHNLESALKEVQTLQGILPICSFCKNVRNDEGYYEKLEGYFHKNSGVDFSHTICPDCLEKNYPEVYEEMSEKGKI